MKRTAVSVVLCALAGSAGAATIPVAPGAVVVDADALCSLREAIANANAGDRTHGDCIAGEAGADTITLPDGATFALPDADNPGNGLPVITSEITIVGNGSTITRASDARFRIFDVAAAGNLTVLRTNVTNGFTEEPDAGDDPGGGIRNAGTLVFAGGTVAGNRTDRTLGGAGLYNGGTATLRNCTLSGNACLNCYGGVAILNDAGATLEMTNCTVSGNGDVNGQTTLGGGTILNFGAATLTNCTVTQNAAPTNNGASGPASGILSGNLDASNTLSLVRTIVAGNFFIPGFSGNYGSEIGDFAPNALPSITADRSIFGHAGVNDEEAFGVQTQADPKWLPDGDNIVATSDGANIPLEQILDTTLRLNAPGETATHALPKGSPAIDFGLDCAALAIDQRGVSRPIDGDGDGEIGCDVGAYEFSCGNGIIDVNAGEECDDGDTIEDALCRADCTLQCGDGELDPGEVCDDGNDDPNDGCAFCRPLEPVVGDPVVGDDDESGPSVEPPAPGDDDEGPTVP